MNKFPIINLFIYLQGLIIIDFFPLHLNGLRASQNSIKNSNGTNNINIVSSSLKEYQKFSKFSNKNFLKDEVVTDLKNNFEKINHLLALNEDVEDLFIDIESDIQYNEEGIFYAEGNAIIYFSDSILKGDLISYDRENKILKVQGNVDFNKGNQNFKATFLFYDIKNDEGYIDNIYGALDSKSFNKDFKLELNNQIKKSLNDAEKDIEDLQYINTATLSLVNDFEEDRRFNITSLGLNIPQITKWRFKANKITFSSKKLQSKKIFFTNDPYNKPQFIFESKNFIVEIINDKLRFLSKNSWIILDNQLRFPIGRRSIYDRDPLTKWGVGADYENKDGFYIFRGSNSTNIFGDFNLKIQPYFLIQRSIKGTTDSYRAPNSSAFSNKIKDQKTDFSDYFALDVNLKGTLNNWFLESQANLNTLNFKRIDESLRTRLTLKKRINLLETNKNNNQLVSDEKEKVLVEDNFNSFKVFDNENNSIINSDEELSLKVNNELFDNPSEKVFNNFLDLQIYNVFREKVTKDFGTEEIYFATGFTAANTKSWLLDGKDSNFSLIYDLGHYKAKRRNASEFLDLYRNVFVAEYDYKFPIWRKKDLDKAINSSYRFTPDVRRPYIEWASGIQSGLFIYSDGSSQSATKFNTGPVVKLGMHKKNFLDYTYFKTSFSYTLKSGESPYDFDNINNDPRVNFNFSQQIFGPLIFNYETVLNLNDGEYSDPNYSIDLKRRAYAIGLVYNSGEESVGIRFNIFNFDYSGLSPKF